MDDPSLSFHRGVFPVYSYNANDLHVTTTIFAPQKGRRRPLKIVEMMRIANPTESERRYGIEVVNDLHGVEGSDTLYSTCSLFASGQSAKSSSMSSTIQPHEEQYVGVVISFSTKKEQEARDDCSMEILQRSFKDTQRERFPRTGYLHVPENPWYGEILTRAEELARQSLLMLEDGTAAGTFSGSNANPQPDVWYRDYMYTCLGLIESSPDLAVKSLNLMVQYAIPDRPWQFEATIKPDAIGFEHSLGNACAVAVLSSLLARRYGKGILADNAQLDDYLQSLARYLIDCKPSGGSLYRTLYISDGPSRGDFHTGSNILAWRAIVALLDDFNDLLTEKQTAELREIRQNLFTAIQTLCTREIDNKNMFVEGVYRDGDFVGIHDGEESDLTLSSIYGFTSRDDSRIREHARWSLSSKNPYYTRKMQNIDFWDLDDSNGITYPSYLLSLASAGTREELATALAKIRQTTDLDGSFWWWPYNHDEANATKVQRSLGKCGWCAGEFVSYLFNNILGIGRDESSDTLTVAPYVPWSSFELKDMSFMGGQIDISYSKNQLCVTNRCPRNLNVVLQLALGANDQLEDIWVNQESRRYQAEVVHVFDSAAVRCMERIPSGKSATLRVKTR
ncbi:hypothetical protein OZX73_04400 [Bifidobacterium sp. ESL0775]|uniref:hypothetical protein n=1 Tax=Bifidobacterium sp. ESL0775 TaxID=2983230 RepID=UPI0023F79CC3|nr:hypothetical protein [Bifidobacterium sp. ESL0775]WEV68548.1 hypothetical protein OZX73_04400 [Bifidobacterium sp. ESL0775]